MSRAVLHITDDGYAEAVASSDVPLLIDFWAPWCAPCRIMEPVLDEIALEHGGRISVGKINVDESPRAAMENDVLSLPTLVVFASGKAVKKLVGQITYSRLLTELAPWLE